MSDLVRTEALTRSYATAAGDLPILQGIDLTLARGEMVALLGPSGAGKSTLLHVLGALDHPTGGRVWFDGQDLFALPEGERASLRNRRMGFVYQFHHLLPEFTALENVAMPLLIGRVNGRQARERAAAALAEVGLEKRVAHKPGQLSGGEQQRVAIARAVVSGPDLLLADEPTGNLDHRTADEIFDLLRRLNRLRGLSCLIVTHNPELAERMDRRLHMVDGRLT